MLELNFDVRMTTPQRYAVRVAQHFEHYVSVHREDEMVRIHFPDATCEMRPGDDLLHVNIHSRSMRSLARCRELMGRHLKEVAIGQTVAIVRSADQAEYLPHLE